MAKRQLDTLRASLDISDLSRKIEGLTQQIKLLSNREKQPAEQQRQPGDIDPQLDTSLPVSPLDRRPKRRGQRAQQFIFHGKTTTTGDAGEPNEGVPPDTTPEERAAAKKRLKALGFDDRPLREAAPAPQAMEQRRGDADVRQLLNSIRDLITQQTNELVARLTEVIKDNSGYAP